MLKVLAGLVLGFLLEQATYANFTHLVEEVLGSVSDVDESKRERRHLAHFLVSTVQERETTPNQAKGTGSGIHQQRVRPVRQRHDWDQHHRFGYCS